MKETVLDVLMFLFEHYLDDDSDMEADQESLKHELIEAGFPEAEIIKAFDWLESLAAEHPQTDAAEINPGAAMRIYTDEECGRLDLECRSLLVYLEQVSVLDGVTRELVIDRVMALETEEIDLEQLKWVILMVLFNRPGQQTAFSWMENIVVNQSGGYLH